METHDATSPSPATQDNAWTTVTPLSKYLALALFVALPFIGGWVGYRYAPEKVVEVERVIVQKTETPQENYAMIPWQLFEGLETVVFNNALTGQGQWVLFYLEGVGKGGPSNGRIAVGKGTNVSYSDWLSWPTEFEWLEEGKYRHKRYYLCGENEQYSPEDYLPADDQRCMSASDANPFVVGTEWLYGDVFEQDLPIQRSLDTVNATSVPKEWVRYENTKYKFRFSYPKEVTRYGVKEKIDDETLISWENAVMLRENEEQDGFYLEGFNDDFGPSLRIEVNVDGNTLAEERARRDAQHTQYGIGYVEDALPVAGHDAFQEQLEMFSHTIVVTDDFIYTFGGMGYWEDYGIIDTFEFL